MYDPFLLVGVETVWQVTINRQLTVVPSDLFIYASVDALLPVARAHDFFYPICCCASVEIDQKKKLPAVVDLPSTNHWDMTQEFTQQANLT
jgi:hypothetical protein